MTIPRRGFPPGMALTALMALSMFIASAARAQDRTRSPHGPLQEECAVCHRPEAWTPVRITKAFDHAKRGFALTGAHQQTACRACHQALDFSDAKRDCVACHSDIHRGELGANCATCHSTRTFIDRSTMSRNHQLTRFPLDGAHLVTDCQSCHLPASQGQLAFRAVPTDCVSCHRVNYQGATNPNHVTGAYPTQCDQCHSTVAWDQARFNHDASGFAITGAHRAVPCSDCHVGNRFTGLAIQCVGCHQQAYDQTTQPNHAQVAFSTDCVQCHSTASWTAPFDHRRTQFPLTGAHRTAICQDCHGDGVYSGKSTLCAGCHQTDYNNTSNPAHQSAGFPLDCASCHTTATWQGAKFDHDTPFFPIYSGAHRGRWSTCGDCHTVASDFHQFTCLSCHEHNKTDMDSRHRGRSGYQYLSSACLSCHPSGRAED